MGLHALIRRLRRRFGGRRIVDPVFGDLRYFRGAWEGRAPAAVFGPEVALTVFAGPDGPTAAQRNSFADLRHRFTAVREELTSRLYEEYRSIRESLRPSYAELPQSEFAADYPPVNAAPDIWTVATLYRIEVTGHDDVDFVFDHAVQWADDGHGLNVLVKDWRVIDVAMEG